VVPVRLEHEDALPVGTETTHAAII
jgi:hypothetical protein